MHVRRQGISASGVRRIMTLQRPGRAAEANEKAGLGGSAVIGREGACRNLWGGGSQAFYYKCYFSKYQGFQVSPY